MKAPIHLWIVGIVSLLWNAGGAYDYFMSKTQNAAYMEMLNAEQLAFLEGVPVWFSAAWAIGVWFSVIGSLLLLMRSRFAIGAFALSLLGLVVSSIYTYGLAEQRTFEAGGMAAVIFSIIIPVVLVLLLLYARAMTRRGVLR